MSSEGQGQRFIYIIHSDTRSCHNRVSIHLHNQQVIHYNQSFPPLYLSLFLSFPLYLTPLVSFFFFSLSPALSFSHFISTLSPLSLLLFSVSLFLSPSLYLSIYLQISLHFSLSIKLCISVFYLCLSFPLFLSKSVSLSSMFLVINIYAVYLLYSCLFSFLMLYCRKRYLKNTKTHEAEKNRFVCLHTR